MNRNDHLGEKVLYVLQVNGRLGVEVIAAALNEKPKAVSAACVNLHRLGKVQRIHTGQKIRNRSGRKKPEVHWEIGTAENIPLIPNRGSKGKRHNVVNAIIGINDEDLEWMERYRQQRQQRQQQLSNSDVRLRL